MCFVGVANLLARSKVVTVAIVICDVAVAFHAALVTSPRCAGLVPTGLLEN